MAEGFARLHAPPGVEVWSAGTKPASALHPLTVRLMAEVGIDVRKQRPKHVSAAPKPDLLVTVCAQAAEDCPTMPGVPAEHWNLPDPASIVGTEQERVVAFRAIRDELRDRVLELMSRIAGRPPGL